MDAIIEQITKWDKEEKELETDLARLTGAHDQLLSTLKKDFNCTSYKKGADLFNDLEEKETALKDEIEDEFKKLKKERINANH